MQIMEIFKPGKHVSANGVAIEFTESDLAKSVEAYDPSIHEAPIVVGHPKDNNPAYGWVKGIEFKEGAIFAETQQVDPEFNELVEAGRFKKRSASFYHPENPTNPVPGVYYLRHVGFLGAVPPAIKGLKEVSFSDGEVGDFVEFVESWETAGLFRRLREFFIEQFGADKADTVIPGYLVEQMELDANNSSSEDYNESMESNSMDIETLQTELAESKAKLDEAISKRDDAEQALAQVNTEFAEFKQSKRKEEIEAKANDLIETGKILPADKEKLTSFMESLPVDQSLDFGEGEEAKVAPLDAFLGLLAGVKPAVDFGEHGAGDEDGKAELSPNEIAKKAVEFQESQAHKGVHVSTTEAVMAVQTGKAGAV